MNTEKWIYSSPMVNGQVAGYYIVTEGGNFIGSFADPDDAKAIVKLHNNKINK